MTANDTLSELFRGMAHPHRRVVLYYLREHDQASLETLAGCVTGWLASGPGRTGDPGEGEGKGEGEEARAGAKAEAAPEYAAVRTRLHHSDLPTLAEVGFVTYDTDSREATLEELPSAAETLLSTAFTLEVGDDSVGRLVGTAEE